jgi:hypothetical protein
MGKIHPLSLARKKWARHKAQSKYRNIPFDFTFDDWYHWWLSHGVDKNVHTVWDRKDRACMCRKGDQGGYELSNVYFGTNSDNAKHLHNNGKIDPYHRKNNRRFRWGDREINLEELEAIRGTTNDNEKRFFDVRTYDWENQHETQRLINRWNTTVRRYKKTWQVPTGIFDNLGQAAKSLNISKQHLLDRFTRKKYQRQGYKKHTELISISLEDYIRAESRYPDPHFFKQPTANV